MPAVLPSFPLPQAPIPDPRGLRSYKKKVLTGRSKQVQEHLLSNDNRRETLHLSGTPRYLSDNGGQEGSGWRAVQGATLNPESFHFFPHPRGRSYLPPAAVDRATLPSGPAWEEAGPPQSLRLLLGDPAGGAVPAAPFRRSGSGSAARSKKVPRRVGAAAQLRERPRPRPGLARLTLQFPRPSPRSHPPRRLRSWGPWRAPRRAPLTDAGVTRARSLRAAQPSAV